LSVDGASSADFASVRAAVSGAAPLSKETLKSFKERFGIDIWEGYGLTETSPALTTTARALSPGATLHRLPPRQLKLVDTRGARQLEGTWRWSFAGQ
jgi:long-chain acyl-CoA synthetase